MTQTISVESVSKLYRLGTVNSTTLAEDLNRIWYRIRGKEDPYQKHASVNDRTQRLDKDTNPSSQYVWALRDVNIQIQQGQIVGLIGKNGAGKSTLLKLLSRVTSPTKGNIKYRGRIASLLEVGTGFHPDMTGLDNIYMNGAILGMRRSEVKKRLEEIVDFSGCGKYIDTPVKRYSTGMIVRLGFAVAAHLECEILIVDEVLAVGDMEFQKKCLGQMKAVGNSGKTVLFVTHNLHSVWQLCNCAILLENGTVKAQGAVREIIDLYNAPLTTSNKLSWSPETKRDDSQSIIELSCLEIHSSSEDQAFSNADEITLTAILLINQPGHYSCCIQVKREGETCFILNSYHQEDVLNLPEIGQYNLRIKIPKYLLNPGHHTFSFYITDSRGAHDHYIKIEDEICIELLDDNRRRGSFFTGGWPGATSPILDFAIEKCEHL